METYFTFTWAPKPRAPRGEFRGNRPQQQRTPRPEGAEGQPPRADLPRRDRKDRPEGEAGERKDRGPRPERGDRPERGGKPFGKGKPQGKGRREDEARSFEARPHKKDRIDPDNPFAAALAGFKVK